MKNKKAQFVLLISVLLIWGLIIYRVFVFISKEDTLNHTQVNENKHSDNSTSNDSIELLINYSDPFNLSKDITNLPDKSIKSVNNKKKTVPSKITQSIPIPKIIYKGTIYNQLKQKYIAIITVNQNSILIYEGDSIQTWVISKIYKDSLIITNLKQRQCICISN